jgi:hypothetical protein
MEIAKFLAPAIHENGKNFWLEIPYLSFEVPKVYCHSLSGGDADEICKEILGLEAVRGQKEGRYTVRQYVQQV